jgi:hypothetical protein
VDFLHQFFGRAVPKTDKLTAAGSVSAVLHGGKFGSSPRLPVL